MKNLRPLQRLSYVLVNGQLTNPNLYGASPPQRKYSHDVFRDSPRLISPPNIIITKHKVKGTADRSLELVNPMERDDLPEVLFNILKNRATNKINTNKIFSSLKEFGIQSDDPRFAKLKSRLDTLADESLHRTIVRNEKSEEVYNLTQDVFSSCIDGCEQLFTKVIINNLIIRDWKFLTNLVDQLYINGIRNNSGKVSKYLPTLQRADPSRWGLSLCTIDGQRYHRGDSKEPVTLQAAQFPLSYSLALNDTSEEHVHRYVGLEASGLPVQSIALNADNIPHNPMMNSGSIVIASLLQGQHSAADRFDYVSEHFKKLAGGGFIDFNNSAFLSERATSHRNMAIAYVLKESKCFPLPVNLPEIMDLYFQMNSIEVNCRSAAVLAATLANGGICPITNEKLLSATSVRNTLALMHSCGTNDYSGQFAFKVGLPAKSAVSGLFLLVVPNVMGVALYSPGLDEYGNSARAVQFCEDLVKNINYHNYDSLALNRQDPRQQSYVRLANDIVTTNFSAYQNDITALRRVHMRGVDLNQADYDDRTALHIAAAEGHMEVVRFLLEVAGVDPSPRDRWDFTPCMEAERFGHVDVKEYLENYLVNYSYDTSSSLFDKEV